MDREKIAQEILKVAKSLTAGQIEKTIVRGDNLMWSINMKGVRTFLSTLETSSARDLQKETVKDSKALGIYPDDEVMVDFKDDRIYCFSDFIGNKPDVLEAARKMGFKG